MVVVRRAACHLRHGNAWVIAARRSRRRLRPGDPPGRVGRLAFIQGTVSFHDAERTDWAPAVGQHAADHAAMRSGPSPTPTARSRSPARGCAWTAPPSSTCWRSTTARPACSSTRAGSTSRPSPSTPTSPTRSSPRAASPRCSSRATITSRPARPQDPTRLGVRAGAAAVPGARTARCWRCAPAKSAEVTGDGSAIAAPHHPDARRRRCRPTGPQRDRQVVYDQPPQYLSRRRDRLRGPERLRHVEQRSGVRPGLVRRGRCRPTGRPTRTGRWAYVQPYGWTWVDEQPWGFAPYHYGRWAQRNNRWFWVPPERHERAVYAPALVAFVGGTELGMALGAQNRAPVGWFPLGPREVYVPPYTTNRDYYRRINRQRARPGAACSNDRWQRAQRHEAIADDQQLGMNRRFATVVPAEDLRPLAAGRSGRRSACRPTRSPPRRWPPSPRRPRRPVDPRADGAGRQHRCARRPRRSDPNAPTVRNAPNQAGPGRDAQTRSPPCRRSSPSRERQKAPGPQVVPRSAVTAKTEPTDANGVRDAKAPLPQLAPRNASAPPLPQIQGERKPVAAQQATAPANQPAATPPQPGEPAKPGQPQANAPANRPGVPTRPASRTARAARVRPTCRRCATATSSVPSRRARASRRRNTQPNAATPNAQPPQAGRAAASLRLHQRHAAPAAEPASRPSRRRPRLRRSRPSRRRRDRARSRTSRHQADAATAGDTSRAAGAAAAAAAAAPPSRRLRRSPARRLRRRRSRPHGAAAAAAAPSRSAAADAAACAGAAAAAGARPAPPPQPQHQAAPAAPAASGSAAAAGPAGATAPGARSSLRPQPKPPQPAPAEARREEVAAATEPDCAEPGRLSKGAPGSRSGYRSHCPRRPASRPPYAA